MINQTLMYSRFRIVPYVFIRRNSTFRDFAKKIEAGSLVSVSEVETLFTDRKITSQEIETLRQLLKSNISTDLANELLRLGLSHDFSLYYAATKNHEWNDLALMSLILNNPGRVFSLESLANKHLGGLLSDEIRHLLVRKLLLGENVDQGDESYKPSKDSIRKAIDLINGCKLGHGLEGSLGNLLDAALVHDSLAMLHDLEVAGVGEWLVKNRLDNLPDDLTNAQYLEIAQLIFKDDPSLLSKQNYCRILSLEDASEQFEPFIDDALAYIELNHMDFDKTDANSLLVRIQLIETYGITKNDLDTMLKKFHAYQSKEKFGIEYVQIKVVKAFCFQSFKENDATNLKIAETLVLPEGLPVSTVAELILANSQISAEKSLEVYNDYIQLVSASLNEVTKRSPKGILTEALIISSLYNNDREFAELVYQKAIETSTISDENEIALIKKVFKAYGDAFKEDSWESAKPIFKQFVLGHIKDLGRAFI